MKTFLFLSLFFLSTTFAKTLPPLEKVLSPEEITSELVQNLIQGMYPNVAIELKKGAAVPLHFLFKANIGAIAWNPNLTVQITSTSYLRGVNGKLFMSRDLTNWGKPKKFFKGNLSQSVKMSEDKSHALIEMQLSDDSDEH